MTAIVIGAGPYATELLKTMARTPSCYTRLIAVDIVHEGRNQIEDAGGVTYVSILDPASTGPADRIWWTAPPVRELQDLVQAQLRPVLRGSQAVVLIAGLADTVTAAVLPGLIAELGSVVHRLTLAGCMPFMHEGQRRARFAEDLVTVAREAGITMLVVNPAQWAFPPCNPRHTVLRSLECVELLLVSMAINVGVAAEGPLEGPRLLTAEAD